MPPRIETIEDICKECCPNPQGYCLLKLLILESGGFDDRTLEQIKCIEIFKYEESERQSKEQQKPIDIGWQTAFDLWCKGGYAERFAHVYRQGMKHSELYSLVVRNNHQ